MTGLNDVRFSGRTNAHYASAVAFAIFMLLGVLFCEYRLSLEPFSHPVIFVPYVSGVLFGALMGAAVGRWYGTERSAYKAIVAPIAVAMVSSFMAGMLFVVATGIVGGSNGGLFLDGMILMLVGGATFASVFLEVSWPVLLPAGAVATVVLWGGSPR